MLNTLKNSLLLFLAIALVSCYNQQADTDTGRVCDSHKQLEEQLLKANKLVVQSEDQQISDLVNRYGWDMTTTGTGLRIQIVESPGGTKIQCGSKISMDYNVRLIDGTEVYNSQKHGIKTFVVGKGEVVAGLEEAMLMLRNHDKARLVIPSFLGHGIAGDGDKIPTKATMIYQLEIIYVD